MKHILVKFFFLASKLLPQFWAVCGCWSGRGKVLFVTGFRGLWAVEWAWHSTKSGQFVGVRVGVFVGVRVGVLWALR